MFMGTHINVFVFRKHFVEVFKKFNEIVLSLDKKKVRLKGQENSIVIIGLTTSIVWTYLSVLVYEKPVPAGWSTLHLLMRVDCWVINFDDIPKTMVEYSSQPPSLT